MIFGSDNRSVASSASFASYSTIVQIISYFPNGTIAQGSGVIVGYNDVLTAAHVVYDAAAGGYADIVEVTPAMDGQNKPYGVVYADSSIVSSSWISREDYNGDYGLVTLSSPVGYYTGFSNIAAYPSPIINKTLFSYGYPGDLSSGKKMYYTSGTVDLTSGNELQFTDDFDAKGGQSGSGVFYSSGGTTSVVGVVSYESYNGSQNLNSILGFTDNIVKTLNGWISANDGNTSPPISANESIKMLVSDISLLYYAFLNRAPDKSGLDFWVGKYESGVSVSSISNGFFASAEYASSAAGSFSNVDFVNNLYTGILNRSAESLGATYWINALNNGANRADVAQGFVFSQEFEIMHALDVYSVWHNLYNSWAIEATGNEDNDILTASNAGDSALYGLAGDDVLIGKGGSDYLWGGKGNDTMTGGAGADFFAWGIGDGYDSITDFSPSQDYIRLRGNFEWSFGVSSGGYLSIVPKDGSGGLILAGINPIFAEQVKIIQGDLI